MSSIECKNCNHHFKGNFCPHCGQKATVERIGLQYFLHDIPHSIFHVDKGFWFTFKELFKRPGIALKEYLDGKRVNHFRPFAYVFIMSAISIFVTVLCNKIINTNLPEGYILEATKNEQSRFFVKYLSLLFFTIIPLLSLVTWLSFPKAKYNYWEHFLINTYLGGQCNILLILIKIFGVIKFFVNGNPMVNFTIPMFLFMFYYSFVFAKLMEGHYSSKQITIRLFIMNFFLSTIYMTAFSFSGIMSAWWNF